MTAAEKLLSLSSLVGCDTAANHFCSITGGDITVEYTTRAPLLGDVQKIPHLPGEVSKHSFIVGELASHGVIEGNLQAFNPVKGTISKQSTIQGDLPCR